MAVELTREWLEANGVDPETIDRALDAERYKEHYEPAAGPWEVAIAGWMPTPLNKLLGVHWGTRSKRKRVDRETVHEAVLQMRLPPAYLIRREKVKRRVSLRITLPKGRRRTDPDSLWKTTLDALVHAGILRDDSDQWCEMGNVAWERGEVLRTIIVVEDI